MADLELGRIGVLMRAHRAKAIVVPKDMLVAIKRATDLGRASEEAWKAHEAEVETTEPLFQAVIDGLYAEGPYEHPAQHMKAHREDIALLEEDAQLLDLASDRAQQAVPHVFVEAIPELAQQLTDNLGAILTKVRPIVQALEDVDFDDPDSIHDAPKETQQAFHVFSPLAVKHDHIRLSALAIYQELTSGGDFGGKRAAVLATLDDAAFRGGPRKQHYDWWLGTFAGGGLVGPAPQLRGKGGTVYDGRWAWAPGDRHAVQRLVDAVLLPEFVAAPEPEDEIVQRAARNMTPLRSTQAILR